MYFALLLELASSSPTRENSNIGYAASSSFSIEFLLGVVYLFMTLHNIYKVASQ